MERFKKVIEKVLHVKENDVRDEMSAQDIPDWDSMSYFLLVSTLEEEFKVAFSGSEVAGIKTIGDMKKLLISKGITF